MKILTKEKLRLAIEELGGETKLNVMLEDFYKRMADDAMIGFFFTGKDIKEIAHKQGEFLLKASGLRTEYAGKLPREAHSKLPPIRGGQFRRRLIILREILEDYQLTQPRIDDWIAFENSFLEDIVK